MRPTRFILLLICWCLGESGVFLARSAAPADLPALPANAGVRAASPPLPKPQVSYFRELLALSPAELDRALASIAEPGRRRLQAKLQEYAALAPGEREARLRATELRGYLAPLIGTPPANRGAQLALIPEEYRRMVEQGLKRWDALEPELQSKVRNNEWAFRIVIGELQVPPTPPKTSPTNDPALMQRDKLEQQLASWLALPPGQRQRMCHRFQQFFELPAREKERILSAFPEAERGEMDKILQVFEKLPPDQRSLCVDAFGKFTDMTPENRAQFLKKAERWKATPPDDRQTWRMIVSKLPPPEPPGLSKPPMPE